MKKFLQRFFGIAVSAALVVSSGMTTVFAADLNHSHDGGTPIEGSAGEYTITLSYPPQDGDTQYTFDTSKSKFGAYQIFSGHVKGENYTTDGLGSNPGNTNKKIPITDIKWGNAFCSATDNDLIPTNDDTGRENILKFVYALYAVPKGTYKYAFTDFNNFDSFITDNKLDADYVDGTNEVTFTVDVGDGKVTNISNMDKVKYDKLAVAISDIVAQKTDREWLQEFSDILGGFGQNNAQDATDYLNPGYVHRYYAGSIKTDDKKKYEIKVPAGYYMIRDLSTIDEGKENDDSQAFSARMLFVANNVEQELKVDVPKLEKTILRDGTSDGSETEVAGVGDVVRFQLDGSLPSNFDLYEGGYQYTFFDTLSKGLDLVQYNDPHADYDANSGTYVTVTVKGLFEYDSATEKWTWKENAQATIPVEFKNHDVDVPAKHYHLSETASGDVTDKNYTVAYSDHQLQVHFACLSEIRIKGDGKINTDASKYYKLGYDLTTKGSSHIYVDYYAKVNSNAVVSPATSETGRNGNQNKAQIQYSDNPQAYGDTDYTTIDNATVYTFGLDIVKVDAAQFLKNGSEKDATLKEVPFMLARPVAATLTDGKTTATTEWEVAILTLITKDKVDSMNPKPTVESFTENGYYSIVSWKKIDDVDNKGATFDPTWETAQTPATNTVNGTVIKTDANGLLNISGLDVDVLYSLAEVDAPKIAPDGTTPADYAKIAPFTFTLSAQEDDEEYTGRLSNAKSDEDTEGSFSFEKPVDIKDTFGNSDDGSANMLVANFKYIDLPSTGGVGTVWFYILGGGVLALSGVLFFLSKKKSTK